MTTIQLLERQVKKLDRTRLSAFRNWIRKYDSDAWDRQIERDVHSGKLEKFAKRAISAFHSGKAKEL